MIYGKTMELDSIYHCMLIQDTNNTTVEEDLKPNHFKGEKIPAHQIIAN